MSEPTEPAGPTEPADRPAPRLVFRDPFDQQSSDDTDRGWGEDRGGGGERGLDWYRSQRPPHHGEK
ncbi:hypothetical protein ACIQBJ_25225 [Kitasatospora sp. NPDC088391]|uniref:hypothetical protein n=1 Tax=Kitasatospora sp. NPDC088391 TaxID=3364074 RepID=UPI00382B32BF